MRRPRPLIDKRVEDSIADGLTYYNVGFSRPISKDSPWRIGSPSQGITVLMTAQEAQAYCLGLADRHFAILHSIKSQAEDR